MFEPKTNKKSPNSEALVALIQTINTTTPETLLADLSPLLDLDAFLRQLAVETYLSDFGRPRRAWSG